MLWSNPKRRPQSKGEGFSSADILHKRVRSFFSGRSNFSLQNLKNFRENMVDLRTDDGEAMQTFFGKEG